MNLKIVKWVLNYICHQDSKVHQKKSLWNAVSYAEKLCVKFSNSLSKSKKMVLLKLLRPCVKKHLLISTDHRLPITPSLHNRIFGFTHIP